MEVNSSWIKIFLSSTPESVQILAVEIVNSLMFKSANITK